MKQYNETVAAGQVDCRFRPRAWMGVGCITGTPVFAMDDEPRPMMMLTPEFMQAQADEAPRLDLGA